MATENTRAALAVMSTSDAEHKCHSAVLELTRDTLNRMERTCSLITKVHDEDDLTLREMRFLGDAIVEPYGHDISDWIDSMGAWGTRWHNDLISKRIAIMPLNCVYMPCLPLQDTSHELVVTRRPDQPPRISWRFTAHDHPVEFFTHPLPFSTYCWFFSQRMPPITPEYEYEHNH